MTSDGFSPAMGYPFPIGLHLSIWPIFQGRAKRWSTAASSLIGGFPLKADHSPSARAHSSILVSLSPAAARQKIRDSQNGRSRLSTLTTPAPIAIGSNVFGRLRAKQDPGARRSGGRLLSAIQLRCRRGLLVTPCRLILLRRQPASFEGPPEFLFFAAPAAPATISNAPASPGAHTETRSQNARPPLRKSAHRCEDNARNTR
jgi:hypothetical protein